MPYLSKNHPIADRKKVWWSQAVRMLTEHWTVNNIFCPVCWSALVPHEPNKPMNDFFCRDCNENFELKSSKWKWGKTIPWWAYDVMIKKMVKNPMHLFVLKYAEDYTITHFLVVPKYFFIPDIIQKRNTTTVKQKNWKMRLWTWGNILFDRIPSIWKIHYIKDGRYKTRTEILNEWNKVKFLEKEKQESKWWIFDVIKCIEKLDKKEFILQDIYDFEKDLQLLHPENNNIQPKIRQTLQLLRDKDYLKFVSKWKYKVL